MPTTFTPVSNGTLSDALQINQFIGPINDLEAAVDALGTPIITLSQISDWPPGLTAAELGYLDGVTSSVQSQLGGKAASSHTHPISQISDWPPGLTAAELGYLDGVTSSVQSQLDGKSGTGHNHSLTGLTGWPGSLTLTELGYLVGVTSSIQTQLGAKASNPTGTPTGSKFLRDDNSWQVPPGGNATYGPGTAITQDGNWYNLYSLSAGIHVGSFWISTTLARGLLEVTISNTTVAIGAQSWFGGFGSITAGSSAVAFRVSGGWLQINYGTGLTGSGKFLVTSYDGTIN
jgi:hypothetical protein